MHNLEIKVAVLFSEVHVSLKDPVVILHFDFLTIHLIVQLEQLKFLFFYQLRLPSHQVACHRLGLRLFDHHNLQILQQFLQHHLEMALLLFARNPRVRTIYQFLHLTQ